MQPSSAIKLSWKFLEAKNPSKSQLLQQFHSVHGDFRSHDLAREREEVLTLMIYIDSCRCCCCFFDNSLLSEQKLKNQ
jgi:hypothetical protein